MNEARRRKLAKLALFERAYEMERNGLFVWRAWLLCVDADLSPPAWILGYLARVASQLDALALPHPARAEPRDPAAEVFAALEIDPSRRGPRGLGGVLPQDGRNLHLAAEVKRRGGGIYDQEAVAAEYGVSRSLVVRACKRYEALLRDL